MKALSPSNKKALSPVIAYVLLITISIALSGLVFNWLKNYAQGSDTPECPEGISLVIHNYTCTSDNTGTTSTSELALNITIKNKGRRNVTGYALRVNDKLDSTIGIYEIGRVTPKKPMKPGDTNETKYEFSDSKITIKTDNKELKELHLIDIQPFVEDESGKPIFCQEYSSQTISC